MIDNASTYQRLHELYRVLIGEGFTITLGQYDGFYAQRFDSFRVPCSEKPVGPQAVVNHFDRLLGWRGCNRASVISSGELTYGTLSSGRF